MALYGVEIMYTNKIPAGTQIGPHETIEPGAPVRVGNKTGYVLHYPETVPARPCGTIVLHEIRLTKKLTRVSPNKYRIDSINETLKPNYSGIYRLP